MRLRLLVLAVALGLSPAAGARAGGALASPTAAATRTPVPPLTGRVVDGANLLGFRRYDITEKLAKLERELGVQLAVLTVPQLHNEPIESFALRAAEAYALGQAGRDNGLLLVAVVAPRGLRLEVGYGLEDVVPDVLAAQWLDGALRRGPIDDITVLRLVDTVVQHLTVHADEVRSGRGRGVVRNMGARLASPLWLSLVLIFIVAWVTLGYRKLGKAPGRPLTRDPMRAMRAGGHNFKEPPRGLSTLVHTLLWALLNIFSSSSRRDDNLRGGGGRFGGGGASGRD